MSQLYYRCHHCDGKAFLLTEMPTSGQPLLSSMARHLDGSKVEPGTPVICDSCQQIIGTLSTARVEEAKS